MSDDPATTRTPVTMCWHCDRMLDAASDLAEQPERPEPGAISLCLYCGAVALFGADLTLEPPTEQLLDELSESTEFRQHYVAFSWARQYVMIKGSGLMRERDEPDR